jgi:hypothetical protein
MADQHPSEAVDVIQPTLPADPDVADATRRTIRILRARANLAAAWLLLDDLAGELRPDERRRHEHDRIAFTTAADQLATHADGARGRR